MAGNTDELNQASYGQALELLNSVTCPYSTSVLPSQTLDPKPELLLPSPQINGPRSETLSKNYFTPWYYDPSAPTLPLLLHVLECPSTSLFSKKNILYSNHSPCFTPSPLIMIPPWTLFFIFAFELCIRQETTLPRQNSPAPKDGQLHFLIQLQGLSVQHSWAAPGLPSWWVYTPLWLYLYQMTDSFLNPIFIAGLP